MSALALPSRHDEAFRYTDTDALARVWPVAVETILVPAGTSDARQISNLAGRDDVVVHALSITLEAGADFTLHLLNAGGRLGRYALDVTLHEGASFTLNAAQIGSGAQTLEIVSTITHAEPGATSRQTVRSILGDGATGTYLGKVAVARDAQQTDSEQSVRAMLLDRHSTANAVPELEIFADDVKCAHGCAVGELDAMSLFYLQSRGLDQGASKRLLLQAFIAELFDGQDALLEAAMTRLEGVV